ncbi:hypothetical protein [Kitasatospora sp. NPDC004531]
MGDERKYYGPLEVRDGRWAVGDSARPHGRWVELRPDGMVQHTGDTEDEPIAWSRVMSGITIQIGRFARNHGYPASYGLAGFLPTSGSGIGYLHMTLRDPYEDHRLAFNRHPGTYDGGQLLLAAQLMTTTVADGNAHLLGDSAWLTWAVERLSRITHWPAFRQPESLVKEALESDD